MITTDIPANFKINIGRPSFTDDFARQYWQRFFDYVETVHYPIIVNGIYHHIKDLVQQGGQYLGGGYGFCFWFQSNDDRKQFLRDCNRGLDMKIEDRLNLTFFQTHEKELRIRISDKYLDVAKDYIKTHPELSIVNGYLYRDEFDGQEKSDGRTYIVGPLREIVFAKAHLHECWLDLPD